MKSNQQNTSNPRSFLKPDEKDKCCKTPQPDSDIGGKAKECLEKWKEKLSEAYEEMTVEQACYNQAQSTYTKAEAWKTTLKAWEEDAKDTHKKAVAVHEELCRFVVAVERTKTVSTTQAVEAVLCLVKSIFEDVDNLLYISKAEGEAQDKAQLQQLTKLIECDDSLDAAKKEKALGCIAIFDEQMKLIQAEQEKLLTKLLEILHSANLLVEAIDKPESSETDKSEDAGIHEQLQDLCDRIAGEKPDSSAQRKQVCAVSLSSTDSKCKSAFTVEAPTPPPPPEHLFPILAEDEDGCSSPYYLEIMRLCEAAENEVKDAKLLKEEKYNSYSEAKTYHDGLKDAIKASEEAKPAK